MWHFGLIILLALVRIILYEHFMAFYYFNSLVSCLLEHNGFKSFEHLSISNTLWHQLVKGLNIISHKCITSFWKKHCYTFFTCTVNSDYLLVNTLWLQFSYEHMVWSNELFSFLTSFQEHIVVSYEPCHQKTCLTPYVNNKDANQPARPRNLKNTNVFAA